MPSENLRQRQTVLAHDKKAAVNIDVFLTDNLSHRRDKYGQPMLAFQVFEEGVEDDLATVYVHQDLAHELRNHLNAFLRYCAKRGATDD